jgi:hypothetical protein
MYTASTFQFESLGRLQVPERPAPAGGATAMTPFAEVPLDPTWRDRVRVTIATQPDDHFRPYFNGRIPTPQEKAAHIDRAVELLTPIKVFQNNLYRVEIVHTPPSTPTFTHLSITRLDGGTCKEWAHMQAIKNEVVGPEYEAIELFPAESRLVNTGNQYHLWVHSDPAFRFPLGWAHRMVFDALPMVEPGQGPSAGALDSTGSLRRPETFTLRPRFAA